jgi:glycosyltransferase involved in cell wall biosynthesis
MRERQPAARRRPLANPPQEGRPVNSLLSIVVPTRNRPRQLLALLDSLRRQSGAGDFQWELVLVDDGSDGHPRAVVERYLSAWDAAAVRLHALERCSGVSRARNVGVELSRGETIAFLDDDILVGENFLCETRRVHAAHPHILVLNGQLRRLRDDYYSRFWHCHYSAAFDRALPEPYLVNRVSSGFCSIKRGLLKAVPVLFDETLPSREDFDLLLRLRAAGIPVYKHDSIVGYNDTRSSLWGLIRQRLWYERGEAVLRRKHGEETLAAFYRGEGRMPRRLEFLPLHAAIAASQQVQRLRRKLWCR